MSDEKQGCEGCGKDSADLRPTTDDVMLCEPCYAEAVAATARALAGWQGEHTPEPWTLHDLHGISIWGTMQIRKTDAERIVACVNALAGASDPAAFAAKYARMEAALCRAEKLVSRRTGGAEMKRYDLVGADDGERADMRRYDTTGEWVRHADIVPILARAKAMEEAEERARDAEKVLMKLHEIDRTVGPEDEFGNAVDTQAMPLVFAYFAKHKCGPRAALARDGEAKK